MLLTGVIMLATLFFTLTSTIAKEPNDTNYAPVEVKNGGTVSGVIKFGGEIPALAEIEVTKDTKVCGKAKPDQSLVVDAKRRGIKNVVAYLKDIESGKKWALDEGSLKMDQKGCVFTPHILVVPTGTPFAMLNNDGILHNVHTRSEINEEINKAQPKFLKKMKLTFEKPEFVKVTCDVHNWMNAWIVAAPNPYYRVTDEQGKFELTDVPAGSYTLEIWHETLGKQIKQVEVKAGETVSLEFTLTK
ncbi:hypothetical protein GWO43_28765 [candidate division KSB1 bacterium]|nr:hypothetical protein [candidate division KSB1 bacterium]NIR71088.1 hypothetical protein [candidate division KSB1 bacterium]NIS27898.1 hypothetical protein [candidate division KSB1 bacterium]NIT74781.1 hypothetical protein [candidate division KSB1 bacterium]NIU28558.1 hypothetical protein [candidate division KSB1 bacterium]